MKIFFLDDDKRRIREFKQRCIGLHRVYIAETVAESRQILLESTHKFDLISLDHDLDGKVYTPSDEKSGFAVAQFVGRLAGQQRPGAVNIHTFYDTGRDNMVKALLANNHADGPPVDITTHAFGSKEFWKLLGLDSSGQLV